MREIAVISCQILFWPTGVSGARPQNRMKCGFWISWQIGWQMDEDMTVVDVFTTGGFQ